MPLEIPKAYEPKSVEPFWVDYWIKQNLFSPDSHSQKTSYVIVIPPPNVTGSLHMGHALNNTLQDILIRWKKMSGYETLWVPGTDHGGIATQNVVEKLLKQEKKTRHDLGREKFLERMWEWRKESGDTILMQLKKLGCSLDWSRTRFTMDETCSKAVNYAFMELYKKGWIYRGKRMVNWCVRCQTALSDIEVEYEERREHLYYIRYPLIQSPNDAMTQLPNFVVVATTRPETMLGDTAVAVHPEDARYKKIHGSKLELPLMNRTIELVADPLVDPEFGTGAVKVTPAHDPADFEIGQRKKLEQIVVIGLDGKMTAATGKFAGLSREECRKEVIEELQKQNRLEKIENYIHSVGVCYRCSVPIEPQISEQWFLKTEEMAKKAIQATQEGLIKIFPDSWTKPYLEWLKNLKDWCLSRQIWWGHRIPVWYCIHEGKFLNATDIHPASSIQHPATKTSCPPIASVEKPDECAKCKGKEFQQDPDVLDTWFSSALWPFSVFGWPEETADLKKFYPTSVLVTGHEILYLWVARMVMFGLTFNPRSSEKIEEQIPFHEVFIHGIVRDKQGRKMSKSLGNVIDPLTMMEKYGTDALRFVLASQSVPGRDMQISDEAFVGARNFCNKLWNASRYVLMNLGKDSLENLELSLEPKDKRQRISEVFISQLSTLNSQLELCDQWILSRLQKTIVQVNQSLETYDLAAASRLLYHFVWSEFCDWYIELSKIRILNQDENQQKQTAVSVAMHTLKNILQLLHPLMPFITEEIWKSLYLPPFEKRDKGGFLEEGRNEQSVSATRSLFLSTFPQPDPKFIDEESEQKMEILMRLITEIRTIRSEMNVHPAQKISVSLKSPNEEVQNLVKKHSLYLQHLCKASEVSIHKELEKPKKAAAAILPEAEIFVPLEGLIDFQKERMRLGKELSQAQEELKRLERRLSLADFKTHAPKEEIVKAEERRKDAISKIARLQTHLESLSADSF